MTPVAAARLSNNFQTRSDSYGDRTQVGNSFNMNVTARPRFGLTLQGGFNIGKTDSDYCEIRRAVPEWTVIVIPGTPPQQSPVNPWCDISTGWVKRATGLWSYIVPKVDIQVAGTMRSDQGGDLAALWVAPNSATVGLNRSFAGVGSQTITVNLVEPGTVYGDRVNQFDIRVAKILRFGRSRLNVGFDVYNVSNEASVLTYNQNFIPNGAWLQPTTVQQPRFAKFVTGRPRPNRALLTAKQLRQVRTRPKSVVWCLKGRYKRASKGVPMKPIALAAILATVIATADAGTGAAADRFDVAIPSANQAAHVLNRAAFGPRPADIAEIKKIGVERWLRQQLEPKSIADSTVLTARLASLESQRLATWQIFETYQPPQPQVRVVQPNLAQLLPQDQIRLLQTGPAEQRRAVIDALPPDKKQQVLAAVAPNVFDAVPDLKQQAERARQIQEEVRNREMQELQRKLRPPLNELLSPEEQRDLQRGTTEEKLAVLNGMTKEKRTLVFRQMSPQGIPDPFRREAIAASNPRQAVVAELIEAKLQRAIYSPRQLEEILVDFWLNHFNVFRDKNTVGMLLTSYERDAIRPHVLGRFRDMVLATARHPAMLSYLDNHLSRSSPENGPYGSNVVVFNGAPNQGLNENYGRELLELHTLGADGGYTQADVINVARAFTGWTIFDANRYGEFNFDPQMHDRGEKVVLGHKFPRGGGEEEGVRIIDLLSVHPSTARFISRKLAQRFVADVPPPALVDRMAATFTRTGGDLRAVMETLLFSKEFMSEGAWQAKVKTPLELAISALRALDAEVTDGTALAQQITDMGQPLYGRIDPSGYPNTADAWTGSAGLLRRMTFANALAGGNIAGVKFDAAVLAQRGVRRAWTDATGYEPAADVLAAIEEGAAKTVVASVVAAAIVGSPDFQKR